MYEFTIEKSWPIHYNKGPSNFSDMGPWAHTLLFLGNTLHRLQRYLRKCIKCHWHAFCHVVVAHVLWLTSSLNAHVFLPRVNACLPMLSRIQLTRIKLFHTTGCSPCACECSPIVRSKSHFGRKCCTVEPCLTVTSLVRSPH